MHSIARQKQWRGCNQLPKAAWSIGVGLRDAGADRRGWAQRFRLPTVSFSRIFFECWSRKDVCCCIFYGLCACLLHQSHATPSDKSGVDGRVPKVDPVMTPLASSWRGVVACCCDCIAAGSLCLPLSWRSLLLIQSPVFYIYPDRHVV